MTTRSTLTALMVSVHRITPELAAYHLARMSDSEVEEQFEMYRRSGLVPETELSAESTITAVNVSSTPLVTPAPEMAGSAFNRVPGSEANS